MKSTKIIYSYASKITDEVCHHNGKDYQQTARISFRDATKNLIEKKKMPVVSLEVLYDQINKKESIDLEGCFVSNFSLTDYRNIYGISEQEIIEICDFNAANALFEADKMVDFGYVNFTGENCSFNNAHFGHGGLSFYKTTFNVRVTDFSFTSYSEGHNIFQFANFGECDLTFEGATFINGNISFVNAQFNDGNVNFKNVNFGDGNV